MSEWVSRKYFVSHHFPSLIVNHAYFKTSVEKLKQRFLPENKKRVPRSTWFELSMGPHALLSCLTWSEFCLLGHLVRTEWFIYWGNVCTNIGCKCPFSSSEGKRPMKGQNTWLLYWIPANEHSIYTQRCSATWYFLRKLGGDCRQRQDLLGRIAFCLRGSIF